MDYSEVRAFREEVSDQPICVLVHPAFPRMIERGKEDVGLQALGSFPVSGELFPVVIGNGVNMAMQRVQAPHRGAMRGGRCCRDSFEMVVNRLLRSTCVSSPP